MPRVGFRPLRPATTGDIDKVDAGAGEDTPPPGATEDVDESKPMADSQTTETSKAGEASEMDPDTDKMAHNAQANIHNDKITEGDEVI